MKGDSQQEDVFFLQKIPSSGTFQLFDTRKCPCEIIWERSIAQCTFSLCPSYPRDEPERYVSLARAKRGREGADTDNYIKLAGIPVLRTGEFKK
ncbi:hypothetical protein TNCV_3887991 [Trichonephila clavipes]|nr:hypothetical protein TNCV_3887991 [Trichonephila clavipes]